MYCYEKKKIIEILFAVFIFLVFSLKPICDCLESDVFSEITPDEFFQKWSANSVPGIRVINTHSYGNWGLHDPVDIAVRSIYGPVRSNNALDDGGTMAKMVRQISNQDDL